jgi:hypothetical protein
MKQVFDNLQRVQEDLTTRRVDPTAMFRAFAKQNHPRYRAETLREHNAPTLNQHHTRKGKRDLAKG